MNYDVSAMWEDIRIALAPLVGLLRQSIRPVRNVHRLHVRQASRRARLVTWHKGNKRKLTRKEKIARGIPRG